MSLAEDRDHASPQNIPVRSPRKAFSLNPAENGKPRVLLVCDEWTPARGGISIVNRELASALARLGHPVMCLVTTAVRGEVMDARRRGVRLVTAKRTPSEPTMYLLPKAVQDFCPDVVVGHDHVSGSFAWTHAKEHFPNAALVHIVHTIPPESEPHKARPGAQARIEKREEATREIARDAAVVAAVGPRVARYVQGVVSDGYGGVRVLTLTPGIHIPDRADLHREVPANPTVLLLGRADQFELKGLDIAAKALAQVSVPAGRPTPALFVRGAPGGSCDRLRERLASTAGLARDRVDVRSFTSDVDQIHHSLRRAALSVMPSRVEPFGLVVFEAIGIGTPVLLTEKSGAAEVLRDLLGRTAELMIVPSDEEPTRHLANWRDAIQRVLDDLPAAFAYTHMIRGRLAEVLSWDTMATALMDRLACPSNAGR
jgi:glycosyltransferase involved in cell wall biosynthesis